MAKYHGKKGVIYLATTGSGVATTIVGLSEWSVDLPTDRVETTEFGATNKTFVQGLADASGSFAGFWDDTSRTIWDAATSSTGCKLYLYPSSDAVTKYIYGPAWLDASISTGIGDAVKISGTFAPNGVMSFTNT